MFALLSKFGQATIEPNHRLNDVYNLPSKPAIKNINSCTGHPLNKGGTVAQLVERATPGQEVLGSIPAVAARSLLVGSVSV